MRIAVTLANGDVKVEPMIGMAVSSNRTLIVVLPHTKDPWRLESEQWSTLVVQTTGGDRV